MFGAFQFQYTTDYFEIKTFGKSGMSRRLMRRFLLTARFKKEFVLTMALSLLCFLSWSNVYEQKRKQIFPFLSA